MKFLLAFCIFLPALVSSVSYQFVENRPSQVFPVPIGTPHFNIDLDYPFAFEVTITAFNNKESETGFCEAFPSKITSKLEWTGSINLKDQEVDKWGNPVERYYDNIEFYKGWYFILDSASFEITAIKDPRDKQSYHIVDSEFKNINEDEQLEETYFILDPDDEILFIITRKAAYAYSIPKFLSAVKANKTPPKITMAVENFPEYDMILSIRYYKHRLYVVADNNIEVFSITKDGDWKSEIKAKADFFDAAEIAITDIAFKGNFAYALDKLKGVYVIDISKSDSPDKLEPTERYGFRPGDTREVQKGQYIEIVRDSLHIISTGAKNPFIFEYIIQGDLVSPTLEFNRKIELFQSVRDSYSDSNYLYLLTGFFNMATKHSIPGRYHSQKVQDYISEYWPLLGAKALVSRTKGKVSTVAVLNRESLSIMRFEESNPYISCNTRGVEQGYYAYSLHAVQEECEEKEKNNITDYNTVCEINQDIQLLMVANTKDVIVEAEKNKKTVMFLLIGIGVLGLLIIVFLCLCRKYKTQYHRLEDKIKFHKLEEGKGGNTEGNKDPGHRNVMDI